MREVASKVTEQESRRGRRECQTLRWGRVGEIAYCAVMVACAVAPPPREPRKFWDAGWRHERTVRLDGEAASNREKPPRLYDEGRRSRRWRLVM